MSEILTPEQIAMLREDDGLCGWEYILDSHESLRAKLAEVERERDEAQTKAQRIGRMADEQLDRALAAKGKVEAERDRLAAEVGRLTEALKGIVALEQHSPDDVDDWLIAEDALRQARAALSPEGKACGALWPTTTSLIVHCSLSAGHTQNHRGESPGAIVQWPEGKE